MITPMAEPAMTTNGKDFDPTSSSWRINSRHSNGGVTAARKTCQEKIPRFPNHSKKPLTSPVAELAGVVVSTVLRPGSGGLMPATVVNPLLLNGLDLAPASRAHCSDACDEARSGVRYTRIRSEERRVGKECRSR